jgi:hypothetical protein
VLGQGVFETLKAVSRLTLRSLKKRMLGEEKPAAATATVSAAPATPVAAPPTPEAPKELPKRAAASKTVPPPPPPVQAASEAESLEVEPGTFSTGKTAPAPKAHELNSPPGTFDAGDAGTVQEFEQALDSLDAPLPPERSGAAEIADVSFAERERPEAETAVTEEVRHVKVRSNIDILAELERLRKTSTSTSAPVEEKPRRAPAGISVDDLLAGSLNHRKEVNKVFDVVVPRKQLSQGHQVTVGLRFEDRNGKEIGDAQSFSVELQSRADIQKLLLSLKFHIQGK